MKMNKLAYAVAASSLVVTGSALALDPQPIQAGAFDITPTVNTDFRHTDNMFLSNTDEVSSNLWIISPRVEARADNGNSSLTLAGQVDEGNFSATEEDDYTDWRISAGAHLGLSGNSALDLNAGLFSTREMRGTGFSQGGFLPGDPDQYDETTFGGSYELGTNTSFGRLVLSANSYDKSYNNNRLTTQFRDRDDLNLAANFYINLSDRTAIVFEYRDSDINYGTDPLAVAGSPDSLDSTENYYYVGMSWQATAKTSGSIRLGRGEKEFDDADRLEADGSSWEANIQWEPLTYSVFNFTASQTFDEATGVGNALETRRYSASWQHGWSDALRSSVNYNHSDDEYTQSTREDKNKMASVRLDYSVQRWLDVYLSVSRDERESSFANFNYEQNVAAIGFAASL